MGVGQLVATSLEFLLVSMRGKGEWLRRIGRERRSMGFQLVFGGNRQDAYATIEEDRQDARPTTGWIAGQERFGHVGGISATCWRNLGRLRLPRRAGCGILSVYETRT